MGIRRRVLRGHTERHSKGLRGHSEGTRLLDERATRLAERSADHIDGGLAFGLLLGVERNVGHLFARVEQGVLGGLGHDVLHRSDEDGDEQRRGAEGGENWSERVAREAEGKEGDTGGQQDGRRDHGRGTPAILVEHEAPKEHHEQRRDASRGRERAHERRVVHWVWEGFLELRPGFATPRAANMHSRERQRVAARCISSDAFRQLWPDSQARAMSPQKWTHTPMCIHTPIFMTSDALQVNSTMQSSPIKAHQG